eukprot:s593_g10.t1
MFGKAPGPDGWLPEHLHRLPDTFWCAAARLWNKVLTLGQLPKRWTESTVTLIPKKMDESRPICLASIMWRCGARVIARSIRPWSTSFIDERSFGGAPGRGVTDAHLKILQVLNDGVSEFIFEDLTAFFDSLTMPVLEPILDHLRAPRQIIGILKAFYLAPMRLFRYKDAVQPSWHKSTAGMQGCPLSPMLALCVGHIWARYVASAHVEPLCYVDDRLLWPRPGAQDRSVCFQGRSGPWISKPGCATLARLARDKGYPHMQELPVLGVRLDLASGNGAPLKLDLHKALRRLQAVKSIGSAAREKASLIRTLFSLLHGLLVCGSCSG